MQVLEKVCHRLTDPVFYRKQVRRLSRVFRKEPGEPQHQGLDSLGKMPAKAVVVVAHPDDEVFCSGLLIQLIETGARVKVLCLTKGEGGPTGSFSREELGEQRAAEMKRSCDILGVQELEFLGHIDPVGGEFRVYAPEVSVGELSAQLSPHFADADWVVSHGSCGEYWHPAHLLVYSSVKRSLRNSKLLWLTFLANNPNHPMPRLVNRDDPAYLKIDAGDQAELRCRALECHASQLGLFGKFAGGTYRDFIDKTAQESYGAPALG